MPGAASRKRSLPWMMATMLMAFLGQNIAGRFLDGSSTAFFGAVASTAQQPFIPQTGAVLITDESGAVIGAAGASGGTGDEDELIVIAGIAAAGLRHT